MDFNTINKKRRIICLISLTLTILIVLLYIACFIIFGTRTILVPIIGIFVMIALLYLLSKFIVYKYYLDLKAQIVNIALKKECKAKQIISYKENLNFISHFYIKNDLNVKSKFKFVYDSFEIETIEFELTSKRNFKSNKVVLAGKYLKFNLNTSHDDMVFIKNFDEQTNKYVDYYQNSFKKKDDNLYIDNKRRYVCFYNDKVNTSLLNIFEKINVFHVLAIKDNVAYIIFIDNTPIFDFKLTNNIDVNTINACSQCFNKLVKLINSIRKVVQ